MGLAGNPQVTGESSAEVKGKAEGSLLVMPSAGYCNQSDKDRLKSTGLKLRCF